MPVAGAHGCQTLASLHALVFPGTAESPDTLQSLADLLRSLAAEAEVSNSCFY